MQGNDLKHFYLYERADQGTVGPDANVIAALIRTVFSILVPQQHGSADSLLKKDAKRQKKETIVTAH